MLLRSGSNFLIVRNLAEELSDNLSVDMMVSQDLQHQVFVLLLYYDGGTHLTCTTLHIPMLLSRSLCSSFEWLMVGISTGSLPSFHLVDPFEAVAAASGYVVPLRRSSPTITSPFVLCKAYECDCG